MRCDRSLPCPSNRPPTHLPKQAKTMGDYLIVGVHSDAEVLKNKGPPVMIEVERYAAVRACKWVDEVVEDAPYFTSVEMLDQYNCDYCVHGDDITTTADGTDCYQAVKDAGRYMECKRTVGISTTELVGRMLLMTKSPVDQKASGDPQSLADDKSSQLDSFSSSASKTNVSHFLPTSRRIVQFSNSKEPKDTDKIVYVSGGFDLFHIGHIQLLKKAKEMGNFVVVGVHDDATISSIYGANYPLMNLHERVLSVLACRYVDEVIIGAPYSVTKDVLEKVYKIDVVVRGKGVEHAMDIDGKDPFELPRKLNMLVDVDHPYSHMSGDEIIRRIVANRALYEARNRRKQEKARLEEKMLEEEQQLKKANPAK
eukprot:Partr_v1_DN25190_c0_g1_i3_m76660 putative Cytidylyltransferase